MLTNDDSTLARTQILKIPPAVLAVLLSIDFGMVAE